LGLVWSDAPSSAAGVFTTQPGQAAPVLVCREALAAAAGRMRGVLYKLRLRERRDRRTRPRRCAPHARGWARRPEAAPATTCSCSRTGVIGRFLDMEKLERGVATLRGGQATAAPLDAARAILTTDTR